MDHEDLVTTFGQSVGVEKAEALLSEALEELGIERKESYSGHEIGDICETIGRSRDGYVRVVANEVRIREQAHRRFEALLEEITDPVVTVTFEGRTPVVEATNQAFEATFGYGPEAVGRSLTDLIVPETDPAESVDDWMRSDDASTEVQRRTADGTMRTFLFRSVAVSGFDGEVEGFGIYTDITERKRRERRLELKNEQLERFASVVSHDLRNPLTVARGNLDLARQAASDPTVEKHIEKVADAHTKMDGLIEDLLELARRGRTVSEPVPTVLATVVEEAWRDVRASDAQVSLWAPQDLTIEADPDRLRQLFENLFRNAVEHSAPPPDARVQADGAGSADDAATDRAIDDTATESVTDGAVAQTPTEETAARRPNDGTDATADDRPRGTTPDGGQAASSAGHPGRLPRVAVFDEDASRTGWGEPSGDPAVTIRVEWADGVLAVEDDGPGIPPEKRDRVLEYGYTTSDDGTGFGLAIVQAVAEAHGWSVTVTEGRDGGARFEFEGVTRVRPE